MGSMLEMMYIDHCVSRRTRAGTTAVAHLECPSPVIARLAGATGAGINLWNCQHHAEVTCCRHAEPMRTVISTLWNASAPMPSPQMKLHEQTRCCSSRRLEVTSSDLDVALGR